MKTEPYQPFRKPNSNPIYIDINSNHPPQILKQLPKSISKRLSENFSSKEVFDKSKALYEKSLNNSDFCENLIYHKDIGNKNQHKKIKKHQRKIIWFNPPFSETVKTNIGKKFFKFINRHLSKHHKMSKIFNQNSIKLSYSCCWNMGSIIASHNQIIIQPTSNSHGCNCRNRAEWNILTISIYWIRNQSLLVSADTKINC